MLNDYIVELKSLSAWGERRNERFVELETAIDVLERFEAALLNELDCDKLLKLKNGYKSIPQSKRIT